MAMDYAVPVRVAQRGAGCAGGSGVQGLARRCGLFGVVGPGTFRTCRPGRPVPACAALHIFGLLARSSLALLIAALAAMPAAWAAGAPVAAPAGSTPNSRSAAADEARLARLRAELVNQLARSPSRVLALSWVDTDGVLHESRQFFSEATLPQPAATTQVVAGASDGCAGSPARLRSPAQLSVQVDPAWSARHPSRARLLGEGLSRLLAQQVAERSPSWFAVTVAEDAANTYMQALTGDVPESAGWRLEITLAPAGEGWQLAAQLRSLEPSAPAAGFDRRWSLPAAGFTQTGPGPLLTPVLAELVHSMHERIACAGPQYPVAFDQGRKPRLLAGRQTGLQVGDRLLLQDRAVLPRRALAPGAMGRLAIVEVTAVGPHRIELMPVAGPEPDGQGRWVAVPL
jgi:hypothetical protein